MQKTLLEIIDTTGEPNILNDMKLDNTQETKPLYQVLNERRLNAISKHIEEATKEVLEYTENPIMFLDEEIAHNHLFAVRGEYCDFYESGKFAMVYLKRNAEIEAMKKPFEDLATSKFTSVCESLEKIVDNIDREQGQRFLTDCEFTILELVKQTLK